MIEARFVCDNCYQSTYDISRAIEVYRMKITPKRFNCHNGRFEPSSWKPEEKDFCQKCYEGLGESFSKNMTRNLEIKDWERQGTPDKQLEINARNVQS